MEPDNKPLFNPQPRFGLAALVGLLVGLSFGLGWYAAQPEKLVVANFPPCRELLTLPPGEYNTNDRNITIREVR